MPFGNYHCVCSLYLLLFLPSFPSSLLPSHSPRSMSLSLLCPWPSTGRALGWGEGGSERPKQGSRGWSSTSNCPYVGGARLNWARYLSPSQAQVSWGEIKAKVLSVPGPCPTSLFPLWPPPRYPHSSLSNHTDPPSFKHAQSPSVTVPSAWNTFPAVIHMAHSLTSFMSLLKCYLLDEAYPVCSI